MAKLYVIAGHGAGDPGACANGYQEAERVRALAARMKALGCSDVEVLDTSRNWYADNGISNLSIPSGSCLLELHMDSAAASARGGHVVIKSGFGADSYDNALAKFISGYFPGRSTIISKRSDLANVNRAAARGVNYRLLECCFISNAQDVAKFNANIDEVASGILGAFGITAKRANNEKKDEGLDMNKDELQRAVWGYTNERLEKVDAYQILRDIRDEVVQLRKEVAELKGAK